MKISHTAKTLYLTCPLAYHMHYNLKLRREQTGSALPFGNAMDTGLNKLLTTRDLKDAIADFRTAWMTQKLNNKEEWLSDSNAIKFSKSNYEDSVLTAEELTVLEGKSDNFKAWFSMMRQGEMFIEQYHTEILPKIKKVLAVQKQITLKNDKGDEISGIADLICEWEDGRILLCDNKTTSASYAKTLTIDQASQLALYDEALQDEYKFDGAAYITILKTIRKRKEPRVQIGFIDGVISEELKEKTFDEFEKVLYGIKMGQFESNHPNCDQPWEDCICKPFLDNQDTTGLVDVSFNRSY